MVTLKTRLLKTSFEKAVGLLGTENPTAVFFQTRFGIHTFGMKFAIDVLILNKNNSVVKLIENLQPNKLFFWSPQFDKVVELPKGEIKKNKITVGEKIFLKFIT